MWVRSSLVVQQVKDLALSLQNTSSGCCCGGFDPWAQNFHMLWAWPKQKTTKQKVLVSGQTDVISLCTEHWRLCSIKLYLPVHKIIANLHINTKKKTSGMQHMPVSLPTSTALPCPAHLLSRHLWRKARTFVTRLPPSNHVSPTICSSRGCQRKYDYVIALLKSLQ